MKKITLTLTLILFAISGIFAQTLEFWGMIYEGGADGNGAINNKK